MSARAGSEMSEEKEEKPSEANTNTTTTAQTEEVVPAETVSGTEILFELNEPLWAVVTFERRVAENLTYREAFEKMEELKTRDVSGLCIVTNEAAARISKKDD